MECYDSYKDSGVEWIGKIPDDWDCRPISTLYDSRNEKVSEKDFPALSVTMQGIVPQLETAAKSNDTENRKLVKKGDFAINSRSDRRGSCGISDYDGSVSLITNVLKPKNTFGMENRYYSYLFSSEHFSDEYYRNGTGIVDDLWSTNWSRMKRIYVPVPSYSFQVKIAKYLDEKTSQIDSLIEKNEKSIELLEEYRKSVISEAVTKGLDPNAPMKDSGVEWIGEIPEEWEIKPMKEIVSIKTGHTPPSAHREFFDGSFPWFTPGDINETVLVHSTRTVSDLAIKEGQVPVYSEGSVLLIIIGGTAGKAGFSLVQCSSNQQITALMPKFCYPKWLFYAVMNERTRFYDLAQFTTMPILNNEYLAGYKMVVPTFNEQEAIVNYLDQKTAQIDSLIDKKKQLIEKLQEYRKSLISECVTGKIKVPGVE